MKHHIYFLSLLIMFTSCSLWTQEGIDTNKEVVEKLIESIKKQDEKTFLSTFDQKLITNTQFHSQYSNDEYWSRILSLTNRFYGDLNNYNSTIVSSFAGVGESKSPFVNMYSYNLQFTNCSAKIGGNLSNEHQVISFNLVVDTCQPPIGIQEFEGTRISSLREYNFLEFYNSFAPAFKEKYSYDDFFEILPGFESLDFDSIKFYHFDYGFLPNGQEYLKNIYKIDNGSKKLYLQYTFDEDYTPILEGVFMTK